MGRAQSAIATMRQQRLRPSGGYASEEPGTAATAARRMVATSEGGGRPRRQSRPERRWFFQRRLHNINSSLQSVLVHAVLGGGWPRWQPLNDTDSHALWARRQSERVLAGGFGNGGIQLQPDDHGARPSAGGRLAAATAERNGFVGDGSKFVL
jgi:hypothetical protein